MPVHILTIPFDNEREVFDDEDLTKFLLNKRVKDLRPEFFQVNGNAYWTVFVDCESVAGPEKGDTDGLDQAQRLLMQRFREWRKEKAEKEGVPVFIIATNKQFVDVIKRAPGNLAALREINGFGKKKVDRYGKEVVDIVKSFYEKRPLRKKGRLEFPGDDVPKPELGNKKNGAEFGNKRGDC